MGSEGEATKNSYDAGIKEGVRRVLDVIDEIAVRPNPNSSSQFCPFVDEARLYVELSERGLVHLSIVTGEEKIRS